MHCDHFTASVAGIHLRFHADGCVFADNTFNGFEVDSADMAADVVDITVRLADQVDMPRASDIRFSATNEAFDDMPRTEWHLSKAEGSDGEETITQCCGEERNVRRASIRYGKGGAVLTISHARDTHGVAHPLVFPLFNIFLSRLLLRREGFLIHSSVVRDASGNGLLFTAKSGTGKSTIAHIFESEGATIVNDDMLAIRRGRGGDAPTAYAIPMPAYAQQPRSARLSGLFLISQSPANEMTRTGGAAGMARLMSNVIMQPFDAENAAMAAQNVISSFSSTPTFTLGFKPDKEVVRVVRSGMAGA